MYFINTLFDFVQNPPQTIKNIMEERNFSAAFLGFIFGTLGLLLFFALGNRSEIGHGLLIFGFISILFLNLCLAFFFAASAHLFLEITTGKGKAAGLFVLLGLSEFAKTLLAAYALFAMLSPVLAQLKFAAFFTVLLLQLIFVLYMMKEAYGLSKIRTFFALVLSFVPSVICLCFAAACAVGFCLWLII